MSLTTAQMKAITRTGLAGKISPFDGLLADPSAVLPAQSGTALDFTPAAVASPWSDQLFRVERSSDGLEWQGVTAWETSEPTYTPVDTDVGTVFRLAHSFRKPGDPTYRTLYSQQTQPTLAAVPAFGELTVVGDLLWDSAPEVGTESTMYGLTIDGGENPIAIYSTHRDTGGGSSDQIAAGKTYTWQAADEDTDVFGQAVLADFVVGVNCGAFSEYDPAVGPTYLADTYNTGGSTFSTADPISNGGDWPSIYSSERWGASFSYSIPLDDGEYYVVFHFAELYHTADGQRVFDLTYESGKPGEGTVSDIDIHAIVGHDAAYDITRTINVTGGALTVSLSASVDSAKINAISVYRPPAAIKTTPVQHVPVVTPYRAYLVDTDTDNDITQLEDGQQIPYSLIANRNVGIYAIDTSATAASAVMNLDSGAVTKTESVSPYAMWGDEAGNFLTPGSSIARDAGTHNLTVSFYDGAGGTGSVIGSLNITYTVEAAPSAPTPAPVPAPAPTPPPAGAWDMSDLPVALPSVPTTVIDAAQLSPVLQGAFGYHPAGLVIRVNLGASENALIINSEALRYPLQVYGGNVVWLRGIDIRWQNLAQALYANPDVAPVYYNLANPPSEINPRVLPYSTPLLVKNNGAIVLEGCCIDPGEINCDTFLPQVNTLTSTQAKAGKDLHIINTLLMGGTTSSPVHQDVIHWQGQTNNAGRYLSIQNSTFYMPNQGFTTTNGLQNPGVGNYLKEMHTRNSNFRFGPLDRSWNGNSTIYIHVSADDHFFENVHIEDNNYRIFVLDGVNHWVTARSGVQGTPGTILGVPAGGDWATYETTGINYAPPASYS